MVDNMVKKRLTGIWDDLHSLKKMLKGGATSEGTGIKSSAGHVTIENEQQQSMTKAEERVNYASNELGAKIINLKATPICEPNFLKYWMGMEFSANPPINMLKSSMEPGNCFAYKGQKADITIQLAHEVKG